jgi:hypothetical protein
VVDEDATGKNIKNLIKRLIKEYIIHRVIVVAKNSIHAVNFYALVSVHGTLHVPYSAIHHISHRYMPRTLKPRGDNRGEARS